MLGGFVMAGGRPERAELVEDALRHDPVPHRISRDSSDPRGASPPASKQTDYTQIQVTSLVSSAASSRDPRQELAKRSSFWPPWSRDWLTAERIFKGMYARDGTTFWQNGNQHRLCAAACCSAALCGPDAALNNEQDLDYPRKVDGLGSTGRGAGLFPGQRGRSRHADGFVGALP